MKFSTKPTYPRHLTAAIFLASVSITFSVTLPAHAATSYLFYSTVALSGDRAPGTEPPVVFKDFGPPSRSEPGLYVFQAVLDRSDVAAVRDLGIWRGHISNLQLVARENDASPGVNNGLFDRFLPPRVPNEDITLFSGYASENNDPISGIWENTNSETSAVVVEGTILNDDPPVVFRGNPLFKVNPWGHVAFYMEGTSSPSGKLTSIWTNRDGVLQPFPDENTIFPDLPDWAISSQKLALDAFAWTGTERLVVAVNFEVFLLQPIGLYIESDDNTAIPIIPISDSPIPEPGDLMGVVTLEGNVHGDIAFTAWQLPPDGSLADRSPNTVWFVPQSADGTYQPEILATRGDQTPETDATFDRFSHLKLTSTGDVLFISTLEGETINEYNNGVIWRAGENGLTILAREGDHAPGTTQDVFFADFQTLQICDNSVVFNALLDGITVTESNSQGLFATDGQGNILLLARTGNTWDVNGDGSDIRIIRSISPIAEYLPSLDDPNPHLSNIVFGLTFTDGTSGIFAVYIQDLIPGDVDRDGDVDQTDLAILLAYYGYSIWDPGFYPDADLDEDNDIDQSDLAILLAHFGESF